jgi:hypothetical protein
VYAWIAAGENAVTFTIKYDDVMEGALVVRLRTT